jgi:hypothetical protein
MDNTQATPQPEAGDICPNLGGLEISGPIEITWADGIEELQRIRQACNRCATYLQDIRHVMGQISSTSGQIADAISDTIVASGQMQDRIGDMAGTLYSIADCVCSGLSAQIEAAERQLQTWEGQWLQLADTYRPVVGIAAILAPIYIRRMEITYAGELPAVMGEIVACTRLSRDPWWVHRHDIWPRVAADEPQAYIMLQPGLQTVIDNIMIYVDVHDEHIGWWAEVPPTKHNLQYHIRITYERLDGSRQPALKHVD